MGLTILDTGYAKPDNGGTQATSTLRANDGVAISLKGAEVFPTQTQNFDDKPDVGIYNEAEVNVTSIENLSLRIMVYLDTDVSTDMDKVWSLLELSRTPYYKVLYWDSITDNFYNKQLVTKIAGGMVEPQFTTDEVTLFGLGGQYYHVPLFVKSVSMRQTTSNIITATIIATLTKDIVSAI